MIADCKVDLLVKENQENERTNTAALYEQSKIKSLRGYYYGLVYTLLDCISYLFIKMSSSYNGFNNGFIRYVLQILFMGSLARFNGLNLLGEKQYFGTLMIRGLAGTACIICSYYSLQFIDVSDTQTIINSSMLITALLGRLFLNEKITISHFLSIFLNITGLLFILRPSFLFEVENDLEKMFNVNITAHNLNVTSVLKQEIPTSYSKVLGVSLSLGNALSLSIIQVLTRSLTMSKIHVSVISVFPTYSGLPICLGFSALIFWLDNQSFGQFNVQDTLSSAVGSSCGIIALLFLNKALEYEHAAKIAMLRISGIFFSMIFQYLILDIEVDFLGLIGAGLIVVSMLMIIIVKIYMKQIQTQKFFKFLAVEI